MSEALMTALDGSYRAFIDGEWVRKAHFGGVVKEYGDPVEVARNLFTNPRLVGDGTWAEVARNTIPTPVLSESLAGWTGQTYLPRESVQDGCRVTGTPTSTSLTAVLFLGSDHMTVTPGEVVSTRFRVTNNRAGEAQLIRAYFNTGVPVSGPQVSIPPGETADVEFNGFVIPEGVTGVRVGLQVLGSLTPIDILVHDNPVAEKSPVAGGYFSGSTTPETAIGVVQPEDFRWRWLGTPNESESVMEIEKVAGFSGSRCIAGVSTWGGRPAMRLIPTSTSNNDSFVFLALPSDFSGTGMGTVHQVDPLSGSIKYDSNRIITVTNPWGVYSPIPANAPGSYPQRISIPARTGGSPQFRINHGGSLGSGDVWWTDIGLFAGNYTGEAFSGSTPASGRSTYHWAGEVDNSESYELKYL